MSQKSVELIIGKLATDEEFRNQFRLDPAKCVIALVDRGLDLTASEVSALMRTDVTVCEKFADLIDPRLQKASLKCALWKKDAR